jgi:hypothetical protein
MLPVDKPCAAQVTTAGVAFVIVAVPIELLALLILILINEGSSDLRTLTLFTTKTNHFQNQI